MAVPLRTRDSFARVNLTSIFYCIARSADDHLWEKSEGEAPMREVGATRIIKVVTVM